MKKFIVVIQLKNFQFKKMILTARSKNHLPTQYKHLGSAFLTLDFTTANNEWTDKRLQDYKSVIKC